MNLISHVYATKWGKAAVGTTIGAMALLGAATAQAAPLSATQISSISSLLQAFGVSSTTITNVTAVLSGQASPSTLGSANAVRAHMIGMLRQGAQGDGVCLLQTLLAADPAVYPEGTVSCYFGPLTNKAVKNFQKKHGIEQVGFIGPKTLAKIDQELQAEGLSIETGTTTVGVIGVRNGNAFGRVCAKVPPGHLIAPGWLKKNNFQQPIVPACQTLPPGIIGKIGGHGSTTGTTTLSISGISAGSILTTSAIIHWTTNLGASSQVEYGTTTSYGNTTTLDSSLVTNHNVTLSGLLVDTVYHYRVRSTVGSSTAVSSDKNFTTDEVAVADTTAPIISSLDEDDVASTTATIEWTTNESATSKVYYKAGSSLDFGTATAVTESGMSTSHSVSLSGLTASTTYQYAVVSADTAGNTATSSTSSFTTGS
jgi:peptidoglycan hydrolase-like protein with peptidoglycan-binding domain